MRHPRTLLSLCLLFLCATAEATHFRYGHYTWEPGSGTAVSFTLQNAFKRSVYFMTCVNLTTLQDQSCSAEDGYPAVGDVIRESVGGTTFDPGDQMTIGGDALLYLVTSIDPVADWLFGVALDTTALPNLVTNITHDYGSGSDATTFLGFSDSCCRLGANDTPNAHINNPDGNYRIETQVTPGHPNRPPVSALPPIVGCPINGLCTFRVVAFDPDGDALRFRLSTSDEAGRPGEANSPPPFIQPGPPPASNAATIDPQTGQYTWDTNGATLGPEGFNTLYSTQVTIEDVDGSGQAKSKVAVDFLIQLTPNLGSPPAFEAPTPACGSTIALAFGKPTRFTVQAMDPDEGQQITLNVAGLPAGATLSPRLPFTSGSPASVDFSWTPEGGAVQSSVITFIATDNLGQQALCSLTLSTVIPTTSSTTPTTTTTTSTSTIPLGPCAQQPAGTVCREATGPCDIAETCTGTSDACPPDVTKPDGAMCDDGNPATGTSACQGQQCVGVAVGVTIPPDIVVPPSQGAGNVKIPVTVQVPATSGPMKAQVQLQGFVACSDISAILGSVPPQCGQGLVTTEAIGSGQTSVFVPITARVQRQLGKKRSRSVKINVPLNKLGRKLVGPKGRKAGNRQFSVQVNANLQDRQGLTVSAVFDLLIQRSP